MRALAFGEDGIQGDSLFYFSEHIKYQKGDTFEALANRYIDQKDPELRQDKEEVAYIQGQIEGFWIVEDHVAEIADMIEPAENDSGAYAANRSGKSIFCNKSIQTIER
jgi:hypothetical protein